MAKVAVGLIELETIVATEMAMPMTTIFSIGTAIDVVLAISKAFSRLDDVAITIAFLHCRIEVIFPFPT